MIRDNWLETLVNALLACNATADTIDELALVSELAETINQKVSIKEKRKYGRVCKKR